MYVCRPCSRSCCPLQLVGTPSGCPSQTLSATQQPPPATPRVTQGSHTASCNAQAGRLQLSVSCHIHVCIMTLNSAMLQRRDLSCRAGVSFLATLHPIHTKILHSTSSAQYGSYRTFVGCRLEPKRLKETSAVWCCCSAQCTAPALPTLCFPTRQTCKALH